MARSSILRTNRASHVYRLSVLVVYSSRKPTAKATIARHTRRAELAIIYFAYVSRISFVCIVCVFGELFVAKAYSASRLVITSVTALLS
jgi:hypothetical protein